MQAAPLAQAACNFSFAVPAPKNGPPSTRLFVPSEELIHTLAGNVKLDSRKNQSGVFSVCCMISFTVQPFQATVYSFVPSESLRKKLIAAIRLKAREVAIDVVIRPHNLEASMACVWKTPMCSDAVRRLVNGVVHDSGFRRTHGSFVKYTPCDRTAVREKYVSHPEQGLRWLQFSEVGGTMYEVPDEEFIQELGKALKQGESNLLMCSTREGYKQAALSSQALLFQVYDILQRRNICTPQTRTTLLPETYAEKKLAGGAVHVTAAAQVTPAAGTAISHTVTHYDASRDSDQSPVAEALVYSAAESSCITTNASTYAVAETPMAASETVTPSTIAATRRVESAASPAPVRRLAYCDTPGSAPSEISESCVPGSGESLGLSGIC
jgi:hypothetical protein